jgi:hypothetical protein
MTMFNISAKSVKYNQEGKTMQCYDSFKVVRFPGEKYGVKDIRSGEVWMAVSKLAAYNLARHKEQSEPHAPAVCLAKGMFGRDCPRCVR